MNGDPDHTLRAFERATERATAQPEAVTYVMTLFVTGATDRSARAITAVQALCETHLSGRHRLAIVDLLDDRVNVRRTGVLAAPTLVLHQPLPVRQFVGDMSEPGRVFDALGIAPAERPGGAEGLC